MELSLQNLQLLSHLCYPTDTRQLTSPRGEAGRVSEREYDVAGVGGGEFALRLVPRQRAAPLYWRLRSHTYTPERLVIFLSAFCEGIYLIPMLYPRKLCKF
jgi:hypothetical protein